ncbi:stromal membrane-associated protein 1 [Chelonus insularis]|uniref:stromal membrane-associated protein 1 n=1 Tax=Chelonus insularis TaxID=460826 RepID=UPI00158EA5A4|nr:stromal membrane-associated protein 1 [Chelonus insularis]
MTSRSEKERSKQIQDKCQNLLTQMLRDEDNKYCVDCDAKGPRWASWNLGIFLCIRCAGIHRNLGVHISKVKSVNLDTWTPEQVVSLQQMGNSRARAVYEANLPDTFRRPQTDCSLESFIRAKYEHKKYIAREWVPPALPKVNWDKELDEEAEKQRRRKKESLKNNVNQTALPPVKKPEVVPQLPKPGNSVSPKLSKTTNNTATLDLLGLDNPSTQPNTNSGGSGDDIFSSFLSAPPTSTLQTTNNSTTNGSTAETTSSTEASKADEESFFNQPAPTPQEKSKMTKDSILALYGTQTQQQSVFGANVGMFNQQAPIQQQYSQSLLNVGTFGQNSFPNQQNTISQHNHGMPVHMTSGSNNQLNLNANQMSLASSMQIVSGPIGTNLPMAPINNTINNLPNSTATMPAQMMVQMGQSNIPSNNSWSNILPTQNIQPAPGSNPFFNLTAQAPPNSVFVSQLSQQMSQISMSGLGKSTPAPLSGQTLSTNLWQ